jgi:hypothetical protein
MSSIGIPALDSSETTVPRLSWCPFLRLEPGLLGHLAEGTPNVGGVKRGAKLQSWHAARSAGCRIGSNRVQGQGPTRRVSSLRCGRAAPRARRECKFEHLSDASQVGLHYPKDCAMCVVVCSKNDAASCVDRVTGEVANRAAGRLTESDTGREVQVVAKVAV